MPMPNTKPRNRIRWASPTAATADSPSRPNSARSVVIMAIWPSWVSAIGQASFTVSAISFRQTKRSPCGAEGAAVIVPGTVMARHHNGCHGERKAVSALLSRNQELVIAVAAGYRGRDEPHNRPIEGRDQCRHVGADPLVDRRIAHEALFDMVRPGLELRLDQHHRLGPRPRQR